MSLENVAVMRRMYEAWNSGDMAALAEVFDPEVEVRPALSTFMASAVYRGHDGIAAWYAETNEPWADLQAVPQRFIETGDRIVVVVGLQARVPGGRVDIDAEIAHVVTIRDGRIVRLDGYEEPAAALQATGLSE
jgi:ketosteroid isomerase-like protein